MTARWALWTSPGLPGSGHCPPICGLDTDHGWCVLVSRHDGACLPNPYRHRPHSRPSITERSAA